MTTIDVHNLSGPLCILLGLDEPTGRRGWESGKFNFHWHRDQIPEGFVQRIFKCLHCNFTDLLPAEFIPELFLRKCKDSDAHAHPGFRSTLLSHPKPIQRFTLRYPDARVQQHCCRLEGGFGQGATVGRLSVSHFRKRYLGVEFHGIPMAKRGSDVFHARQETANGWFECFLHFNKLT